MRKAERKIWSSEIDTEHWDLDGVRFEYNIDEDDDVTLNEVVVELNEMYLEDEIYNHEGHFTKNTVVAHYSVETWNGHYDSFGIMDSTELSKMLVRDGIDTTMYIEDGEYIIKDSHHDGTNYTTYRELKDNVSLDEFKERMDSAETEEDMIEIFCNNTQGIGHYFISVYER